MLETLLRPAVLAPTVLVLAYIIRQRFFKKSELPELPIIGVRKGDWFPLLQAKWRNFLDFKAAVNEAYRLHKEQAVICPVLGMGNMIILPASETQFVVDQPDRILNIHEHTIQSLQLDYTVMDPYLIHNPVHNKLIVTTLTNQIGNLVPDVSDETAWSFAQHWGTDTTEWKEVCVYDTMRKVIGSVTNRVFVGLPTCRDPALLDAGMAFAQDIPLASQVLRVFWKPVRVVVAPLVTLPNRIHTNRFYRLLKPEIERRLQEYDPRHKDPESKMATPNRNDFLQWSINQAKESGDPYMYHPKTLSGRVLSKQEYIAELRAEISSVLAEHCGQWNKRALAKMHKLDSVLRESARLNSFVTIGLSRLVVAEEGMTTPSGVRIPKGCVVSVHSYPVLQDPQVYPDAQQFQPFRFAEWRQDENVEDIKRARNAFATTSNCYLVFGHGRNACPGRFFAANKLKLMLGHLAMNYDFDMQESRPRNMWFGLRRVPPMQATIKVRRRERA
ncbi:cytochrome P450 [Ilyonectria robusta]|uniref:cytochrome P450 n=1 Tax=Ilyonectria robusta TaxID=1079257 RepID=UPI001E8E36B9|nr:cytochrome P450 [Ilyonectria robusta]KAH8650437.1 cytochrome P450 [Ilyonectria robusta]